jgi:hypothetical protein
MKKIFLLYRPLLTALLADVVFLFFVLLALAALAEVLLPTVIASRFPLALLYALFAFLLVAYGALWVPATPNRPVAKILLFFLLLVFILGILLATRAFGIVGASLQVLLFGAFAWVFWKK